MRFGPPCCYMGGKRRFSSKIVGWLLANDPDVVYDLCCGSGAILTALRSRGLAASQIMAVDSGPWGSFGKAIGEGAFDLDRLSRLLREEWPTTISLSDSWLKTEVAARFEEPEAFLVLQANAWGGLPVSSRDGQVLCGGRPYTSCNRRTEFEWSRRARLFGLARACAERLEGLRACRTNVADVGTWLVEAERPTCYMDPPYLGTTGYSDELDVEAILDELPRPLFISEQRRIPGAGKVVVLGRRQAGSISGANASPSVGELLNVWRS